MNTKVEINADRKTAIIVGVLFIIATVFLFIGEAFYAPYIGSPNYLDDAYPNRTLATIGMLLEFTCVLAIPLIPIFLFPILRKYNETLALGYVVFRLFEAVLFILIEINKLSLINVSQQYLNSGVTDATYFQNTGTFIQSWNDWTFTFYLVLFTVGGLMLYSVLYSSRLVPRFISVWGLIAAALLLVGSLLVMLEVDQVLPGGTFELIFALPIAVNEMVLAAWLILKGFNQPAVALKVATV